MRLGVRPVVSAKLANLLVRSLLMSLLVNDSTVSDAGNVVMVSLEAGLMVDDAPVDDCRGCVRRRAHPSPRLPGQAEGQ